MRQTEKNESWSRDALSWRRCGRGVWHTGTRGLPKAGKVDKLAPESMADKQPLQSEGEQLDRVLEELQRDQSVKEISGWETGFASLSRALDGILPGLYLLIGPPACGKTALAKQMLDKVAMHNRAPGIFFTFAESKEELRE